MAGVSFRRLHFSALRVYGGHVGCFFPPGDDRAGRPGGGRPACPAARPFALFAGDLLLWRFLPTLAAYPVIGRAATHRSVLFVRRPHFLFLQTANDDRDRRGIIDRLLGVAHVCSHSEHSIGYGGAEAIGGPTRRAG